MQTITKKETQKSRQILENWTLMQWFGPDSCVSLILLSYDISTNQCQLNRYIYNFIILYPELSFPLHSIHLCQRSFYKIFVKFSDLFSSLLIFTIIKTNLSTFFFTVSNFYKNLVKNAPSCLAPFYKRCAPPNQS